jgi:hypothetical protein
MRVNFKSAAKCAGVVSILALHTMAAQAQCAWRKNSHGVFIEHCRDGGNGGRPGVEGWRGRNDWDKSMRPRLRPSDKYHQHGYCDKFGCESMR